MILRFYRGETFVDVRAADLNAAIKKLQESRPDVYRKLSEYHVERVRGSIDVWV